MIDDLQECLYDPVHPGVNTSEALIEVMGHDLCSRRQVCNDVLWVLRQMRSWRR
ncbi:hypothetical protein Hanom_Chr08g00746401 [Helianthus anomalus]